MKPEEILALGKDILKKEADAILNLRENLSEDFLQAVELLNQCEGKVIVIGIGKSGLIGKKIAASLSSLGTPSFFVHAGEAAHGDLGMLEAHDVILAISHSGETPEILNLLPIIKQIGCKLVSITGTKDCTLAREANVALVTGVTQEADPMNLAPTNSSTATLALGDALAVALAQISGFTKENFAFLHLGGALGRRLLKELK